MPSAFSIMKRMDTGHGVHGVVGLALDTGVGFGVSYALGQTYHRYGDKWWGRNAPRLAAVVGKVGAVAASILSGGHSSIVGGLSDAVGQAGVNAIGLEMGLRHARKSSGKVAALLPAGTDVRKIAGAQAITTMGGLGPAAAGRGLSWSQIEALAQGH